jgi:peroxiredoxin
VAVEGACPDYSLASLAGAETTRAAFAGKVVIYDFWATWCGPCHLQADIFREQYAGLRAKGVEIVGIATGEEPRTVRDFAARNPFPWPILLDPEEKVSGELEVLGLPTLVITCKSGAISFRQTGIVEGKRLDREIDEAQSC